MIKIKKIQDSECDWYWIPENEVDKFELMSNSLNGKDYMDCPDRFDDFESTFGHYRTGGDPNLTPDCLDGNHVQFI